MKDTLLNKQVPRKSELLSVGTSAAGDFIRNPIKAVKEGFERERIARQAYEITARKAAPTKKEVARQVGGSLLRKGEQLASKDDTIVNTGGYIGTKVGNLMLPGVGGYAGDLLGAAAVRRGIDDRRILRKVKEAAKTDGSYETMNPMQKARYLWSESRNQRKLMREETQNNAVGDVSGWAVGNTTAAALQSIPVVGRIPFKGAVTASQVVPEIQGAVKRIKAGEQLPAVVRDTSKKIATIPQRAVRQGVVREKTLHRLVERKLRKLGEQYQFRYMCNIVNV